MTHSLTHLVLTIPYKEVHKEATKESKMRAAISRAFGETIGRCNWKRDLVFTITPEQYTHFLMLMNDIYDLIPKWLVQVRNRDDMPRQRKICNATKYRNKGIRGCSSRSTPSYLSFLLRAPAQNFNGTEAHHAPIMINMVKNVFKIDIEEEQNDIVIHCRPDQFAAYLLARKDEAFVDKIINMQLEEITSEQLNGTMQFDCTQKDVQ